jgi:hypothetical protein
MQCPVCHLNVVEYVEVGQIAPPLHATLFDLCPNWKQSPGICYSCMDSLDFNSDTSFQSILNGSPISDEESGTYIFDLTEHDLNYWFHSDENIRQWFRADLRRKVQSIAHSTNHLNWTITDSSNEVLDCGEVP